MDQKVIEVTINNRTTTAFLLDRQFHKVGGPAVIHASGGIEFFYRGRLFNTTMAYCKACGFDEQETLLWVLRYGENLPSVKGEWVS